MQIKAPNSIMSEFISKGSGHHDRRGNSDGVTQDKNCGSGNDVCLDHEAYQTALSLTLLSTSMADQGRTTGRDGQQEIDTKKLYCRMIQKGARDSERKRRREETSSDNHPECSQKILANEQLLRQEENKESSRELTYCSPIKKKYRKGAVSGPNIPQSTSYHHEENHHEDKHNSKQQDSNKIHHHVKIQKSNCANSTSRPTKQFSLTASNLKIFDEINDNSDESTSSFSNSTTPSGVAAAAAPINNEENVITKNYPSHQNSSPQKIHHVDEATQKVIIGHGNDTTENNSTAIISKSDTHHRHVVYDISTTTESSMTTDSFGANNRKVTWTESRKINHNNNSGNKKSSDDHCGQKVEAVQEDKSVKSTSASSSYVDRSQQPDLDPSQPLTPQNRTANFITKLYIVLTIRTDLQHVIQWLPHGRSFRIVDPVEFELSVIPNYFGLMTLASFYKKIELFGFRRIAGTTAKGACNTMGYASYFHEYFLRGRPWIYKSITKANNRPESKGDSTNRNSRSSRLFVQDSTECAVTEEDLIQANHAHSLPGVGPDLLNNPYQSSLCSIDAYLQKHGPKARLLAGLCNVRGPFPMADEMMASPESTHLTARNTRNVPKPMSACISASTFSSTSSNGRESQNQSAGKGHVTKVVSKPATTCLEPKLMKRRLSQTESENNATWGTFNGTNHQSQQHQHHHRQGQCLQQIQNQKQTHINCVGTASTQQHDQSSTLQQLQLLHMLGQFQSQNENQAATTGITNILQLSPLLLSAFVNTNAVATPTTNLIMQQQQQHQSPLQQHTLNVDDMKYGSNNVSQSFGCQPQPNVSTDIFQELARQILTNTPTQPNLSTPTAVAAFPQGYSNNIPSWSYNSNNYPPTNWNRNDSTKNNISSVSSTKMDTTVEGNIHPNINKDFQHLLFRAINSGMIKGAAFTTKN